MPSSFRVAAFDVLDSTNTTCIDFARDGEEAGLVVVADSQTKGRGRRGRQWISEQGNLFCSILMRPKCSVQDASNISFIAALAIHETVSHLLSREQLKIECKWPNDVLIEDKKISGILLETVLNPRSSEFEGLIIGMGINICYAPDNALYPCACLQDYVRENITREELLSLLLTSFSKWWDIWQEQGFSPIRDQWLRCAKGLGKTISVNYPNHSLNGIFDGLDLDGALILKHKDQETLITAGDIFFNDTNLKQGRD